MAITISGSGITSANIADGTIVNADVADVAASKLTGALPAIDGSALTGVGKVLQVVSDTNTAEQITSSTSWVDTNLILTIAPSSTTSKVLLQCNFQEIHMNQSGEGVSFRFVRNGTPVFTPSAAYSIWAGGSHHWGKAEIALDTPNTTSAITYKVQVKAYTTTGVYLNHASQFVDTLIAMEIGV